MLSGYAKVADFNVKANCDFEFYDFTFPYPENIVPDIEFDIVMDDIKRYRELIKANTAKFTCAWQVALEKISQWLPSQNSFLLHSATFEIDGQGIAFSAKSGTGKTTHMLNWQKLLGDKLTIVNGDKPIIRFFDDEPNIPYAYGTPWCGKERFGNDSRTKLKHICFIERSATNYVTHIDKSEAISRIMKQVYMPSNPQNLSKTLVLIDRLLSCCDLWIIHCNMEPESAEVAYNAIINGKIES